MDDGPADALRLDLTRDPASRHSMPFLTASRWRRDVRRCQAHLELGHLAGCVGHLLHGQAEPVPQKPDPLTAGPGDEFFGTPLLSGGVRVVHDGSVLFGRYRLGAGQLIGQLLVGLRPALESTGDWELVRELARSAVARGSSAARQRAAHGSGGARRVVDTLITETRAVPPWLQGARLVA